ncbi:MAG: CDP-diacylglycerol--serine O-phosphatidyltransferase [Acidobacteria bacterium]|nr:CDP-diacylglycerol--serine O-phosphatidyltransferase [Acidobacteriota bacterium]
MKIPKPPRRAAYALPTLFTAGNVFLGFLSIFQTVEGAIRQAAGDPSCAQNFDKAAAFIGMGVAIDGLDGRIARLTNTVSDFGREMDSLADVIGFGVAPAVLAFVWGVYFVDFSRAPMGREHLLQAGYFLAFIFLLCGAMRLARFNITTNAVPSNPGRPGKKYFVGLPIPAAAGMLAAIVYFFGRTPLTDWMASVAWLALVALLAFLMVCTWRYRSFKDLNLLRPRSPVSIILLGAIIYVFWNYSRPALLALGSFYCGSGIVVKIAGALKRKVLKRDVQGPPAAGPEPEGTPIG